MTPRIHQLSSKIIAQIAAGEVVERPASVVKELVENSLDAGATQIKISLQQAGIDSIIVEDNGHGLTPEELELAVQAHTTSKISSLHDLQETLTFGFRGEALHSMAAVGELRIASRPLGASEGMEYATDKKELEPIGLPFGTRVTLLNLFADVPARRKFLGSHSQELKAVVAVINHLALAHPHVGFRVLHHKKQLLDFPPEQTLAEKFFMITKLAAPQLIPIRYDFTHFHFSGLLGIPQAASTQRHHQYLMINQRPVTMPEISKQIKQIFGRLIEPKHFPVFNLNVQLPPSLVDANVHPRKQVVRFIQPATIQKLLDQVITEALAEFHTQIKYEVTASAGWQIADGNSSPYLAAESRAGLTQLSEQMKKTTSVWKPKVSELKEILQLDYTYLLVPTSHELLLFDQHAAHERILFEQYCSSFHSQALEIKQVQIPLILTTQEEMLLEEHQKTLEQIGFSVAKQPTESLLTSIPTFIDPHRAAAAFSEVLADLNEEKPLTNIFSLAERTLAYLACHSAVQAGEYLAPEQRFELITKLLDTPNHSTCPHGRPTLVKITQHDLERMFKRTGGSSFR